ncbi:hypothetical protein Pcinc_001248 [Petrolisthes cinctipes]|uniref:Uncharacterized protein n=1 Tax=Petrolisthes cinctipes TaxID=88211 RepID=A0AAE1L630_PETCI|nr:hypothetical protein Pcinc_001248 [Petrolisthes cinctipes]
MFYGPRCCTTRPLLHSPPRGTTTLLTDPSCTSRPQHDLHGALHLLQPHRRLKDAFRALQPDQRTDALPLILLTIRATEPPYTGLTKTLV